MSDFNLYEIARYKRHGTNALMQIIQIKDNIVYGRDYFGGRMYVSITYLRKAVPEEIERFRENSLNWKVNDLSTFRVFDHHVAQWQDYTFPDKTGPGILEHLKEEVNELIDAETPEHKAEEAADVFLLLLGYCNFIGIDIIEAAQRKFNKITFRKYGRQNEKGYSKHIEEKQ